MATGATIGRRIRWLRKERGLSQETVARRTNIGLRAYGELERGGTRDPHYLTLVGVANALGVSVVEVLSEEEPGLAFPKASAPPSEAAGPPDPAEIDDLGELGYWIRKIKAEQRTLLEYDRVVSQTPSASLIDQKRLAELEALLERYTEQHHDLAPPLAVITEQLDEPTEIRMLRPPTDEERANLKTKYPNAQVVEAYETVLVWSA